MGVVSEVFESILSLSKKNIKLLILIVLLALISFPVVDVLIIRPLQINQKIDLLQKIGTLDSLSLSSPEANALRKAINQEIDQYLQGRTININPVSRILDQPWKFVTGAVLWVLFFLILLFQRQKLYVKILALILVLFVGAFLGYVGTLIPNIFSPIFNYIFYPIVQIVFLASLFNKSAVKKE